MRLNHIAAAVTLGFATLATAQAADTGAQPCKTTAECAAQAERIGASGGAPRQAAGKENSYTEQFSWLNRINKASVVMLAEEKIVEPEQARKIARGIQHAIAQGEQPDGKRPSDVLQIERIMIDEVGPEASL
nr:argininosuccinate lyase [Pseudomonas sp.]